MGDCVTVDHIRRDRSTRRSHTDGISAIANDLSFFIAELLLEGMTHSDLGLPARIRCKTTNSAAFVALFARAKSFRFLYGWRTLPR